MQAPSSLAAVLLALLLCVTGSGARAEAGIKVGAGEGAGLNFPDFFLLGVQKSSTTFMSKLLARNPSLCFGAVKEPHYFDAVDALDSRRGDGMNDGDGGGGGGDNAAALRLMKQQYIKNFRRCSSAGTALSFDATPLTWLMPHRLAAAYSPQQLAAKKFIVVLRHPVDREFSWYNHQLRGCLFQMRKHPFKIGLDRHASYSSISQQRLCIKLLNDENHYQNFDGTETNKQLLSLTNLKAFREYALPPAGLRGDSSYSAMLNKWLNILRRDQILILNFRSSITNRTATLETISNFLDLKVPWPANYTVPGTVSSLTDGAKLDCETVRELNLFFDQENKNLADFANGAASGARPRSEPPFLPLEQEYKCK
jgi:hypothetical protein